MFPIFVRCLKVEITLEDRTSGACVRVRSRSKEIGSHRGEKQAQEID